MNRDIELKTQTFFEKYRINIPLIFAYLVLISITIIVFLPLLITLFAAFKTGSQIGTDYPLKLPSSLYLENFKVVFTKGKIFLGFRNSMILVIVSIIINTILGSITAYTLNRFNFRLKNLIFALFMLGMIVPVYITEVARFPVIKDLGAYNTIFAPVIIYAATDLMQLYIYFQFLEKIPISLDESAMIDGCTCLGIFWKIIFPLLLPATATIAIIKFVDIINDMYIPYLYMPSGKLRTLTTTLMDFSSARSGSWEMLSAAIIVVMLPTIIFYLFFQQYILSGIVSGAVKE